MRTSRWARFSALPVCGLALGGIAAGCLDRPIEPLDPRTSWTARFKQTKSGVDKIDLLLMIDNSASMADKQNILSAAVPNLVKGLLNPPCVGADNKPIAAQPAAPTDSCPAGSAREFQPVFDVHIGIVSSSLGGHGANSCVVKSDTPQDFADTFTNDDHGHLLARLDATDPTKKASTYNDHGFLAWDPKQALMPPGDSDLDTTVQKLRDLVHGVGQRGCGFEAQLESWYRFLVDPAPYGTISLDDKGNVVTKDVDHDLLNQRADFLRPDSMVAILMLTDENDCSTREESFFPDSNVSTAQMPRGRTICATKPDDRCCAPCGHEPKDCPKDDACQKPLTADDDPFQLRCFNQKQRFGIDFLYPVERYIKALTEAKVEDRDHRLVDNPLYPPDPTGTLNARTPESGLVYIAGIVGVPWQDIARVNADGKPDLLAGLDAKGNPVGGFMNADELAARDKTSKVPRWDVILGDPAKGVLPLDPLMWESRDPRTGTNPITGDDLAPPTATSAEANPINGHEWNAHAATDLEYACVFKLPGAGGNSDCAGAATDGANKPLCQDASGNYTTTQLRAKGYPGLRQLSVLKGVKKQGIVASVCPAQVDDPKSADYGYQPAIGAIIERLKAHLTGQCLTRPLTADSSGHVKCTIIEASKSKGAACCSGTARQPVSADHQASLAEAKADPSAAGDDCFCEITQLSGGDLKACQTSLNPVPVDASGAPVDGWCYVDENTGKPEIVASCNETERHKVRFVGAGQPSDTAVTFITCAGDN